MKMSIGDEIRTTGITEQRAYSVAVTGKMFSATMDKLYSNKLGSTIREVCSNAYDSHRSAGKADTPFKIVLPTAQSEEIVIQDFGTGLPNERIFKLFGTLFESSKDQSNNDVGGFGLGSKSPFSIADTFTIVSNWEGTKTHFLNFKDGQGIPQITITSQMETDEDNGITVIIPIEFKQLFEVRKEIRRQLTFFEPKPLIEGEETPESWWKGTDTRESIKCSLTTRIEELASLFECNANTHLVQIGPVVYPLDISRLSRQNQNNIDAYRAFRAEWLNPEHTFSFGSNRRVFISEFPIGQLDISPSREALSYIPDTVDKLNAYFKDFFEIEEKLLTDFIMSKNTAIERAYWYNKIANFQHTAFLMKPTFDFDAFGYDAKETPVLLHNMPDGENRRTYDSKFPIPSLYAWSEATVFQATVQAKITGFDGLSGAKILYNLDDIEVCDPLKTKEIETLQPLNVIGVEKTTPKVGDVILANTEVVRNISVLHIRRLYSAVSRKKDSQNISIKDLFAIFHDVSDKENVFIYNDSPKKSTHRMAQAVKEYGHTSYVLTPNLLGDNARHCTPEAFAVYISKHCGVSLQSVLEKVVLLSSLSVPLEAVAPKAKKLSLETPVPKIKDELRDVHWDNRTSGTAGVMRSVKKSFFDALVDTPVFLIVPIQTTLKETYKVINGSSSYVDGMSKKLGIPLVYTGVKTTKENIEFLKSKGGVTAAEYVLPAVKKWNNGIGVQIIIDTMEALIKNGDTSGHINSFSMSTLLTISSRIKELDKTYKLPVFFEELLQLETNDKAILYCGNYKQSLERKRSLQHLITTFGLGKEARLNAFFNINEIPWQYNKRLQRNGRNFNSIFRFIRDTTSKEDMVALKKFAFLGRKFFESEESSGYQFLLLTSLSFDVSDKALKVVLKLNSDVVTP